MTRIRVGRKVLIVGIALSVALLVLLATTLRRAQPINVILITIDTLRADHLGSYGYARQTSPNFDELARSGVLFANAFSQSSETNPSLSSLMTGYHPHETTVVSNFYVLPDQAVTLAEMLRDRGYRTGAIVSNYSLSRGSGFEQGFETYDDHMRDPSLSRWTGIQRLGGKTTDAAVQWLGRHPKEPFFLWVHFMDPHYPYLPPPPHNTAFLGATPGPDRWIPFNEEASGKGGIEATAQLGDHHELQYYMAQYDGEIRYVDACLGDLLAAVRALGLMDRSLTIVAADHGEGMGEHDYYFAHHEFLYHGLIHVPLLVRFPDRRYAGEVKQHAVANIDILPTILDTLRIPIPKTMRGRNLLAVESREIFAEATYRGLKRVLMTGAIKLISEGTTVELYDLARDPGETANLAQEVSPDNLATIGRLRPRLEYLALENALSLGAPIRWNVYDEPARRLKSLGYVQ